MKVNPVIAFGFVVFLVWSCNSGHNNGCAYTVRDILKIDTPAIRIGYRNDTLTEVRDVGRDSSMGIYTFDGRGILRFYGFFTDEEHYRFSEEYDQDGNIISHEGSPLLEYRLSKQKNDTVLFNASLYSLKRKYQELLITSNQNDTIRPEHLFKSDYYSNVKTFAFKIRAKSNINNLILYAHGTYLNECNQVTKSFNDTVYFKHVNL